MTISPATKAARVRGKGRGRRRGKAAAHAQGTQARGLARAWQAHAPQEHRYKNARAPLLESLPLACARQPQNSRGVPTQGSRQDTGDSPQPPAAPPPPARSRRPRLRPRVGRNTLTLQWLHTHRGGGVEHPDGPPKVGKGRTHDINPKDGGDQYTKQASPA
jgi:hypothetical protein